MSGTLARRLCLRSSGLGPSSSSSSLRQLQMRWSSTQTDTLAPPLLAKLRADMKVAMKAKDANRLSVLRSVLAETTNASKTSRPIHSDLQLLSLLRKRAAAARAASEEFRAAGREDLGDKETAQAAIMDEYAEQVETVDEREIKSAVEEALKRLRAGAEGEAGGQGGKAPSLGLVMKALMGPEGSLKGRLVDPADVARIVNYSI